MRILYHRNIALLCAGVLLALALMPSRAAAECSSAAIHLPDRIVFQDVRGEIHARVHTNLEPGEYTLRYVSTMRRFEVRPANTTQAVLTVSLNGSKAVGRRYRACVRSMRWQGVPLVVIGAPASRGQGRGKGQMAQARAVPRQARPSALKSAQDLARAQTWADMVEELGRGKGISLSAQEVDEALARRGIPGAPRLTSREVVYLAGRAHGVPVEWHIAEEPFAELMRQLVKEMSWKITVIHTPVAP